MWLKPIMEVASATGPVRGKDRSMPGKRMRTASHVSRPMWRLTPAVPAVLAMILTACNESSKPQADQMEDNVGTAITSTLSETPSPSGAGPINVCTMMTMDAILAAVGGSDPKGTKTYTDDNSDCSYGFTTSSPSGGPVGWGVDVQVWDVSTWEYQRALSSRNRKDVPELGDAAFTQSYMGARSLWVKHGDKVISVSSPDHDESETLTRKIAELALTYW